MANKRISRHRLLIDHQIKGNLRGLLERGVQESPDREEEFDPSLEVAIGYAGSVGTALWTEVQEDRAKVCPGYDVTMLSWLNFGIVRQNGVEDGGVDRQPRCCHFKD